MFTLIYFAGLILLSIGIGLNEAIVTHVFNFGSCLTTLGIGIIAYITARAFVEKL